MISSANTDVGGRGSLIEENDIAEEDMDEDIDDLV